MSNTKSFTRKTDAMYALTKKYLIPRELAATLIYEQDGKFAFVIPENSCQPCPETVSIESANQPAEKQNTTECILPLDKKEFTMNTIDPVAAAKAQAEAARAAKAQAAPKAEKTVKAVKEPKAAKPVKTDVELVAEAKLKADMLAAKEANAAAKKAEREAAAAKKLAVKAGEKAARDAEKMGGRAEREAKYAERDAKALERRAARLAKAETDFKNAQARFEEISKETRAPFKNGKRLPGVESKGGKVWAIIDQLRSEQNGTMPERQVVITAALAQGIEGESSIKGKFYGYRKYHGIDA